jgi:hypothetical protein
MKALLSSLACLLLCTTPVFAQATEPTASSGVSWQSGASADEVEAETDAAVYNSMSQNGSTPDAIKLSCRITAFEEPEIDISVVSMNIAPTPPPAFLNITMARQGGGTLTVPMLLINGGEGAQIYRWATQDQNQIANLDTVFPEMSTGPISVSNPAANKEFVVNDTGSYGGSVGLANNVIHDCLSISVHARTEAAGMTSIHDLEVLEGGADDECRSSSDANGQAACDERRQYILRLNALGACYGEQSQDDADMKWRPCDANSNREDP